MMKFRSIPGRALLLSLLVTAAAKNTNAQYANYFTNQVFSTTASTTAGGFNGGTYSVANPNGATIGTFTTSPGSLPSGSGFPGTGPSSLTLNSGGTSATITITFSTPLTPADHIYFEDFDNAETASISFLDASSAVINPSTFRASQISTNFNGNFSMTPTSTAINISAGATLQTEPLFEIVPNVVVNSVRITFNNPNGGGFAFFFGRNKPVLTQSLSTSTLTRGRSATLTYTLSGINNNPVYQLGFSNALPSGWKIAGIPQATGTRGTLSAPANGSTVALTGMDNAFASTGWTTSTSWTVDVSNADNQLNASCSGNPVAFSNRAANFTTSSAELTNNVTAVCFTVAAPLPLELSSFTAAADACSGRLRWESAYETEMAGYEVERSADGHDWIRLGQVPAMNTQARQVYEFVDESAPQGRVQYRLRMAGMSGEASYSAIASVRTGCQSSTAFSISPNPASSAISCSFATTPAAGSQISLGLFDLAGRSVARIPARSISGTTAGFDLPKLAPGLYLIQATINGVIAGTSKLTIR